MRIELKRPYARWRFFAARLVIPGGLLFLEGRVCVAELWDASAMPERWLAATRIEPDNAQYWEHVGLYKNLDFDRQHALPYLQRAATINPHSDSFWMELPSAYEAADDKPHALQAYESAQSSHPISPEVAWRYSEGWETTGDVSAILNEALPASPAYYLTAMKYFLSQKETGTAVTVWRELVKLGQPIEMRQAIPIVDDLLNEHLVAEAEQTWKQAMQMTNWPQDRNENGR